MLSISRKALQKLLGIADILYEDSHPLREEISVKRSISASFVLSLLVAMFVCSCASEPKTIPEWQKKEITYLQQHFQDNHIPDVKLGLSIDLVESFDGRTILAGGSYGDCRSALLRSTDAGKTWEVVDVWLYGCEVCKILFLDAQNVWFVTCWRIETKGEPHYVFRSTDAGKTWQRSETELPSYSHIETGIWWITDFSFSSPSDGGIALRNYVGDFLTYATTDGGVTYHLKSRAKLDPEKEFDEPQSSSAPPPFKGEEDPQHGVIYIKSTQDNGKTYKTLGTLPYYYTFKDLKAIPKQVK